MTAPARPTLTAYAVLWAGFFAAVGVMGAYMPLWYQSLGLTPAGIGLLLALPNGARLISPYLWGWWGDHTGQRVRLLRLASALAALAAAGLVVPGGTVWLGACVVVMALGQQGMVPLGEAAQLRQMQRADGSIDTGAYGRVRLWGSVGFIAAVVGGGWALQGDRLAWFPWLSLVMFTLTAAVPWWLSAAPQPTAGDHLAGPGAMAVLRQPAVAWFFASVMATVLAHISLNVALSLYLEHLGYRRSAIGLIWAVGVVVEVLFFWQQGRFFPHRSPHQWLMLAAGVAVLRFGLTAQAAPLTGWQAGMTFEDLPLALTVLLVLCQITHAITFGAHHSACTALIAKHFPDRLRGRGGALYAALGYGVPGILGTSGGGWLAEHVGYPAVFQAAAVAALVGMACVWQSMQNEARAPGLS